MRVARATARVRIQWLDQEGLPGLQHRTVDDIIRRYCEELSLSGEKSDAEVAELVSLTRLQESPPCDDATSAVNEVAEGRAASSGDASGQARFGAVESCHPPERRVLIEIMKQGGYKFLREMVAEADPARHRQLP